MGILEKYLNSGKKFTPEMMYYTSALDLISKESPETARSIMNELENQNSHLKLIASENYSSLSVQAAMGNLLTDKYAEGYAYHRYYAGTENVDAIESDACEKAKELFGAECAYVQPHCGADANMIAYWAVLNEKVGKHVLENCNKIMRDEKNEVKSYNDLNPDEWNILRNALHNQKLLALDYTCGGHLTHGFRQNISAQLFDVYTYGVGEDGLIDYDYIEKIALSIKPLIILAGYSAYPRKLDFERFRQIADKCGAVLMVDMAHFAGLVAGKVFTGKYDPVPYADIVTTTTHKTLRGPRGGMILCKKWLEDAVNGGCPMVMGGPLPQMMAAKAIALKEASTDSFKDYAIKIVENSQALADALKECGVKVQTDGTDNHIVLVDVSKFAINGRQAESALLDCGIICNRNALPNDPNGAWYTSGLRLGTPALTTRGFGVDEMKEIATIIAKVLIFTAPKVLSNGKKSNVKYNLDSEVKAECSNKVKQLLSSHPLYPELDLAWLKENL